ncbi:MAG TPA: hypothetical protein VMV60_11225 [Thermoanaerobaculia bacterium]|nr:hypothetical protein [Thermoanaerobaculia bacterium]
MKALPAATALLAALLACGCASPGWEKTESVPGGKLYVPKVYAPLLPGSIYPDKKTPVPAKGRPAIVVVCPAKGDCREKEILERAAQRGLVVLVGREPKSDLLRTRAEADAERIGWLLVSPTGDFLRGWREQSAAGGPIAVLLPAKRTSAAGAEPPKPSALSPFRKFLFAASPDSAPSTLPGGAVLKLYSPDGKGLLPDEAYRDAVEWLAGALEVH